ncbi:hypothetical protein V8G54_026765 [Vigna mungo]|uniref:Ty3/gypsy retrotransposon protein n=1 Tax=Vigna mungo TaxID=3915 RepID=A0AAQ3N1M5_VIGMU
MVRYREQCVVVVEGVTDTQVGKGADSRPKRVYKKPLGFVIMLFGLRATCPREYFESSAYMFVLCIGEGRQPDLEFSAYIFKYHLVLSLFFFSMAEGTRFTLLSNKIDELLSQMSLFSTQMTDMHNRLSLLETQHITPHSSPRHPHSSDSTSSQRHFLKLDVPRFDGTDLVGWIFKISQFFEYHNTPEEERITVASFYLDGAALAWFQWMYRNGQILSWLHLLQALEARFAPTAFEDPRGKLFKLSQTSSVSSYLTEFESTANRVTGLSPPFLLSCFLSGLRPEIRREVVAQQPQSLSTTVGLAQLQEEKLLDISRVQRPRPLNSWSSPPLTRTVTVAPPQQPPRAFPPLLPTPTPKTRYRQLTEAEMADRREKGLSFNCDQKYSRSHWCPARFFLFISEEDNPVSGSLPDPPFSDRDPELDTSPVDLLDLPAQISLHALSGTRAPETLRLTVHIAHHPIRVLVDGGSTHNFIQKEVATRLGLAQSPTAPLKVLVGSGEELACTQVCPSVELLIQGHSFHIALYVLDMGGSYVVLGAQWLKQLGPILMDYQALTMKFVFNQSLIELKGDSRPQPTSLSLHQLKQVARADPTAQFFSLVVRPSSTPNTLPDHPNPKVRDLLSSFTSLFSEPSSLPPPRNTDHAIPLLPNSQPVNVRPYKYPHFHKLEIERQVSKMIASGWIQPSSSPFSSPVLLLKKKDGSWRMCVDYRALNAITVKDRFPLPTVEELLDELGSARCFSKLELTSGFHQIRLQPSDIPKTAFRTHNGHYEYCVMPFGLCNAPATFQSTMNDIFRPLLRRIVIFFFDDILVFSADFDQHLTHLRQIAYLGHIVSNGGVSPDLGKIEAMVKWPVPTCTKGLRGFLGLTDFYRKFGQFQWSTHAQKAFDSLKSAMTSITVLALLDFDKTFYVQTDASGTAMGAVLTQDNRPIAYFSKVFCPRLSKSSAYVRELHAITSAVKRWRQSLKELLTQVIQTPEQQHYLIKLLGYDYEIRYKPGRLNVVADALSRSDCPLQGELHMLSTPQFVFLNELKESQLLDSEFILMRDKVLSNPSSYPFFRWNGDLLLYRGKIWISNQSKFIPLLLREFHETPVGGHAGVSKTLKRISANFFWGSMAKDTKAFVSQCDISLDFVTGLPPSNGYTVLLVVVDRFSKAVHLGALNSSFTAYKVAELFVSMVCKHHGLPKSIFSDRDPVFISRFWCDLFKFNGTLLRMSSSYHPQTDGQTEVMNRTIHQKPSLWFKYLPWAEYHYNTSWHFGSGVTPFEVVYGKSPSSLPSYIEGTSSNAGCDVVLSSREEILSLLRRNLLKAQSRMKKQADSKRREVVFEEGTWVYLKLQPYKQVSISGHKYHKLTKRFYGPYKVIERIGPVAYRLELPSSSKIHNIFHCSMLKHHERPIPTQFDLLPPDSVDNSPLITPLAVLDLKTVPIDGTPTRMTMEKWDKLKLIYDLEDKVLVEGEGIDTQVGKGADSRPKRVSKKPSRKSCLGFVIMLFGLRATCPREYFESSAYTVVLERVAGDDGRRQWLVASGSGQQHRTDARLKQEIAH